MAFAVFGESQIVSLHEELTVAFISGVVIVANFLPGNSRKLLLLDIFQNRKFSSRKNKTILHSFVGLYFFLLCNFFVFAYDSFSSIAIQSSLDFFLNVHSGNELNGASIVSI